MTFTRWILLLITVLLSTTAISSYGGLPPTTNGSVVSSISSILKPILPGVVNVMVTGELPANYNAAQKSRGSSNSDNNQNYPQEFQELGSGVIIDAAKGYIVTNAHVIANAKLVTVTLQDGRRFKAKLIGFDKASDVAVVQINATNLVAVPFGNSDTLQAGDFVAAIGSPFGLQQTVTSGVVSALNRSRLGIEGYENFIQTDASINPGNSGGALVNLKGQLIGVNTALIGPVSGNVGIGLAIPSNMVKEITEQLIQYGKVKRGVLGVMVQDLTPALADAFNISGKLGALVTNVIPGSPADKAGVQPQDVIEQINNVPVINGAQVKNTVGLLPIDSKVTLLIHRKDKNLTISAVIIDPKTLKQATAPALTSFLDGVRLTTYDQFVPDFGAIKGVGVLDVSATSDAWISGLRPGDVILESNGKAVHNVDDMLKSAQGNPKQLLLKVGRDQGIIYLVLNKYQ